MRSFLRPGETEARTREWAGRLVPEQGLRLGERLNHFHYITRPLPDISGAALLPQSTDVSEQIAAPGVLGLGHPRHPPLGARKHPGSAKLQ